MVETVSFGLVLPPVTEQGSGCWVTMTEKNKRHMKREMCSVCSCDENDMVMIRKKTFYTCWYVDNKVLNYL